MHRLYDRVAELLALTCAVCCGSAGACLAGEVEFELYLQRQVFDRTGAIGAKDIDHDGSDEFFILHQPELLDVVFSVYDVDEASGFHRKGATVLDLPPADFALGDFDGDGEVDVVLVSRLDDTAVIRHGNGNGTFDHVDQMISTGDEPIAVEVGDMNGDGQLDFIVANYEDEHIDVFTARDNGEHARLTRFFMDAYIQTIAIADVNADSLLDILVCNEDPDQLVIIRNLGNDAFDVPEIIETERQPVEIAVGDLSGDSYPELVLGDEYGNGFSVLFNAGDGTFPNTLRVPTDHRSDEIELLDVNQDGHLDVILGNAGIDTAIHAVLGDGHGGFGSPEYVFHPGRGLHGMILADLNGDDVTDLAGLNSASKVAIAVFRDEQSEFPRPIEYACATHLRGHCMIDLDLDGHLDFIAAGLRDGGITEDFIHVYAGLGGAAFAPPRQVQSMERTYRVAAGNMDDDSLPDIVTGSGDSLGKINLIRQHEDGAFEITSSVVVDEPASEIQLADMDNDQRVDVVYRSQHDVGVVFNRGGGLLGEAISMPIAVVGCHVGICDLNNDSYQDLVVHYLTDSYLAVYLNDGDRTFSPGVTIQLGSGFGDSTGLAINDLNDDGHADIVVGLFENLRILLGDGTGAFPDFLDIPTNHSSSNQSHEWRVDIVLADLDRDGRTDIVHGFDAIEFHRNLGDGSYAPSRHFVHGGYCEKILLGDLDRDGDLDVTRYENVSENLWLFSNFLCPIDLDEDDVVNGSDLFQMLGDWGACDPPPAPGSPCPSDLDQDGQVGPADLSMLLSNWGPCRTSF